MAKPTLAKTAPVGKAENILSIFVSVVEFHSWADPVVKPLSIIFVLNHVQKHGVLDKKSTFKKRYARSVKIYLVDAAELQKAEKIIAVKSVRILPIQHVWPVQGILLIYMANQKRENI